MMDYQEIEVKNISENIKMAKDAENTVEGYISKNTNFRSNQARNTFLFDTGATVCIIGLEVARDNNLKISKLKSPRNIIEASGAKLDIVGQWEFYIKLSLLGKTKKVNCLVLRGNIIDREILISRKMLKTWRMIHPTFPNQSVKTYMDKLRSNDSHVLDSNNIYSIYEKSLITTKEKLSQKDQKCTDLRNKILKDHHDIFKE